MLQLESFDTPRGLRRPIDTFFRSLSLDQSENAICVVLSGTGGDGSSGLKFVKENGGLCIAQDPASAKYDGMPSAAIATGIVDYVLTPSEIAPAIVEFVRRQRGGGRPASERGPRGRAAHLARRRRPRFLALQGDDARAALERRLQVLGLDSLDRRLSRVLREDPDEPARLMSELLINVTRFFRDAEAFETLRREAIAPLVGEHAGGRGDPRLGSRLLHRRGGLHHRHAVRRRAARAGARGRFPDLRHRHRRARARRRPRRALFAAPRSRMRRSRSAACIFSPPTGSTASAARSASRSASPPTI